MGAVIRRYEAPPLRANRRVSVIVPTRNRAHSLGSVLRALLPQARDLEAQVIVVDNGSTDGTDGLVSQLVAEHPGAEVDLVRENVPGLLAARHCGAVASEGSLLIYADDDAVPSPGWLEALASAFTDERVVLATGRVDGLFEAGPPTWLRSFWTEHPDGLICDALALNELGSQRRNIDPNLVWGVCFAIRRDALVKFGGFHPDAYPQDLLQFRGDGETALTESLKRAGSLALYEPAARVQHMVPRSRMRPAYFVARAFRAGIGRSYVATRLAAGAAVPDNQRRRAASVVPPFLGKVVPLAARIVIANSRGYRFHQGWVRKSPEVRDWTTRPTYWDYRLPLQSKHA